MTDEKILELVASLCADIAQDVDIKDAWVSMSSDALCAFGALVRREALEEAKQICKQRGAKFDDIGRPDCAVGAHVCACQIEVLAAQEGDK